MQGGEVLSRILSQYQFFNYILTGAIFTYSLRLIGIYNVMFDSIFIEVLVYYAVGLFLSRLATVTLEPSLKKIGYIKYSSYPRYLKATTKDAELDNLSQQNNLFKTAMTASLLISVLILMKGCATHELDLQGALVAAAIGLIFMMSYKKQTGYMNDRIDSALGRSKDSKK